MSTLPEMVHYINLLVLLTLERVVVRVRRKKRGCSNVSRLS